jgi:hypothetical protein
LAAACLLIGIAWPSYAYHKWIGMGEVYSMTQESPVWMSLAAQLRSLHPMLQPDARLLFFHDPMSPNVEDLIFLVRLDYRERTLTVDRAGRMPHPPSPQQMSGYDAVFDYQGGKLIEIPQPTLNLHPAILAFFDADWRPIGAQHPAHPGDRIITRASGLGPTDPETAPGAAFPRDPLADSILQPHVRVNGRPASVQQHFGSPGEVNVYRFDFRVPAQTEDGMAQVQLVVGGNSAPPVALPVRH